MEMMRMKDYLDVLIPRGGASLIASVVENSTVPVIETGRGTAIFMWMNLLMSRWQRRLSRMQRRRGLVYAMHVNP